MTCAKLRLKKSTNQQKVRIFLTFIPEKKKKKSFSSTHSDYASTLWDSASDSLQKPLKSLHRRAIKIVHLKRTSLTDKDYKAAQILPLSSRLMSNTARFVHKIVSGRAPMYLSIFFIID